MADLTPKQITPGDASRGSVVHASDADTVGVLSRSHNEEDISRLQSAFNVYDASVTYIENDVVINPSGVLVKANKTTTGVFVPADWDLVVGIESLNSDTEKDQTISGGTGIDVTDSTPDHSIAIDGTVVTLTDTQTLTNKTLTSPSISDFTSATHDHEDAAGGGILTATDALDATGTKDSTTFLRGDDTWAIPSDAAGITSINSDTTAAQLIAAGTGLDLLDATNTHTLSIDNTVATLTGTQTLTNKTLTTPAISDFTSATHDHEDAAGGGTITSTAISDFASAVSSNTAVSANTAKVTNATHTGDVTGATALTLESVSITGQTLKATAVGADEVLISDSAASGDLKRTTVAQFLADAVGVTSINSDTTAAQVIAAGTGLDIVDATNTHTLSIDNTVATLTDTQTLTNKTIALGSNTISGTTAQFNTSLTDDNFVTIGGTETITGAKTFGETGDVGKLIIAGTTSGTTTLDATAVASGILTLPAATDVLVGRATTDTLTNKTIDGDDNTILDINETQQNVSVGVAGTVLTSNGVGSAPTYQSQGGQTRTDTTLAADQAITANGDTDITNLTVTLPTVTGKFALVSFNINFFPSESDRDVVFRVSDNAVATASFARAGGKNNEYTGLTITYIAQMAGQVVKAVCARDAGADPSGTITIMGATAPASTMQVLELA